MEVICPGELCILNQMKALLIASERKFNNFTKEGRQEVSGAGRAPGNQQKQDELSFCGAKGMEKKEEKLTLCNCGWCTEALLKVQRLRHLMRVLSTGWDR